MSCPEETERAKDLACGTDHSILVRTSQSYIPLKKPVGPHTLDRAPYICPKRAVSRSWTPLQASYGPLCVIKDCHYSFVSKISFVMAKTRLTEVAIAVWARRHSASPFATESLGPKYRDPSAIALSSKGCVHSRKTNVARCRMGKVGMNRTKNM